MISIVVCSRNRADLLSKCIKSLLDQNTTIQYEVIIVDNASTDHTKDVIMSFSVTDQRVQYVYEPVPGSSRARNTGVSLANYNYLGFVDDDGRVRNNFIERAAEIIKRFHYECFGGWFVPWYLTAKPKWFPDAYGSYPCFLSETGLLENHYVPCGIMFVKKDVFISIGGFSEEIGMKGELMGYGEENLLQDLIRKNNGQIGFSPDLILEHLVADYKYNLRWQLKRFYFKGRDSQMIKGKLSFPVRLIIKSRALIYCFGLLFKNFPRLRHRNYYLQNWILDSLSFPLHLLGRSSVS